MGKFQKQNDGPNFNPLQDNFPGSLKFVELGGCTRWFRVILEPVEAQASRILALHNKFLNISPNWFFGLGAYVWADREPM